MPFGLSHMTAHFFQNVGEKEIPLQVGIEKPRDSNLASRDGCGGEKISGRRSIGFHLIAPRLVTLVARNIQRALSLYFYANPEVSHHRNGHVNVRAGNEKPFNMN